MARSRSAQNQSSRNFLSGGTETAELVRSKDWSATPLGPVDGWPQSLRTTVSLCLASNFPINIIWGAENTQIYNDGYRVVCGEAHPRALGEGYDATWASAWPAIGEPFERARSGETSFLENQRMFLTRNGYLEETFFTFSLSPIRDESGGIGGVFHPVTETTITMLAERRTRALRDLTARLALASDVPNLIASTIATLAAFEFDLPFLLIYAAQNGGSRYGLMEQHGVARGSAACPEVIDATATEPWPIADALAGQRIVEIAELPSLFGGEPCGPYEEPPKRAVMLPITVLGADRPPLIVVSGASPRLPFDDVYRGFYELLGAALSAALATVRAREDERIIERKAPQIELRQAAAEFEALAENVSQFAWMAEPDGSIFWYNRRWYEYTGADLESMKNWGWRDIHHPDHIERVLAEVRGNWAAGKPWEGTYLLRSAQGEYRWFLTRAEPIRNEAGELVRWFGTNTDVTAQRAAEIRHRLALSLSDRLKGLSESREIVAAAVDVLGRHLGVSRVGFGEVRADDTTITFETDYADGVAHLVGTFPTENFGRGNIVDLRRGLTTTYTDLTADPRTNDSDWAAIETRSAMAAPLIREGRLSAVLYLNHRDLREWAPDEVTLVEDVAARVWDALERARAETALHQLNATLEERVDQEVARRAEAEEALRQSQKMEAMGQLTGGVAHDFNNLLTPIVGSLDMLQRKGLGGEREQRLIAGAMQSAERAKTLVQRLLAFARRQPLQPTAIDTVKLVTGMADLIGSTSGPQIKIVVEIGQGVPPAMADPNQLEMALLNLAVNARDAMPEGGTLRISVSDEKIGTSHRTKLPRGRYVRLSIADTGVGMDEATLARAVEPFFSTKGVGKGTGLGLSMVHGLASQLGGAITIQSRNGVGTNVELWLPASSGPAEASRTAAETAPGVHGAGVALLVDDEELVRMSTADMLSDLGYAVVEAGSAEEALKLIREGLRPDLLVSDHLMPGMNGAELARVIRGERPNVQVLIVSGYAESEGVAPDLPRLTKPFRNDELAASLAALPSAAID